MEQKCKIGAQQAAEARRTLEKYRQGKRALEQRIIEDDKWYRLRHWDAAGRHSGNPGDEPASAWLFNSLLNKHGDMMDNFPSPAVLPREPSDRSDAQALSAILPVILERSRFEEAYSRNAYPKLQHGTACYGVFWDNSLEHGRGDIRVTDVDPLSLFWEPGVSDIQDSRNLFVVSMVEDEVLAASYPGKKLHAPMTLAEYQRDDPAGQDGRSAVIDWYYKRPAKGGGMLVHYCKFVGDTVLYASENDPLLREKGFYDHGKYPFVLDILFPVRCSAAGFGFVDVMKSPQMYIDELDRMLLRNARLAGKPRWFVRDACGVNEEEFADWERDFVHVAGRMEADDLRQVEVKPLPAFIANHRQMKVQELKETSGNRDFAQGGTTSGVTAASAIAALQEAGNKLSRDLIKGSYRAFSEVCYLIIELIRQFYDEERAFRITGENGGAFIRYSNAQLRGGGREPVFDIVVKAQKSNPFSQLSQNEQAKELYRLGFFRPELAEQALGALELMQFEGIEGVRAWIAGNAQRLRERQERQQALEIAAQQAQTAQANAIRAPRQPLTAAEKLVPKEGRHD